MRSKFVTCQAPKPAPRSRRKRQKSMAGAWRAPRTAEDGGPELLFCRMSTARSLLGLPCLFGGTSWRAIKIESSTSPNPKSSR